MNMDELKYSLQAIALPDAAKRDIVQLCYAQLSESNRTSHQEKYLKQKTSWKLIFVPVAFLVCTLLAVPAFAGAIPAVYDLLYAISPATAQFFKPVQMFSENNDIRMEVVSAYVQGNTMEVLVTLQDLEGVRVDASTDLFDSYSINAPFEHSSGCTQIAYDQQNRTATFLVTIAQWGKRSIQGDKITFSLKQFLSEKNEFEGALSTAGLNLSNKEVPVQVLSTQTNDQPYLSGGEGLRYEEFIANSVVLVPTEKQATPVGGVTITGAGYVDGYLHIQVHYDNVLKTDNHGYLFFKASTGEEAHSIATLSFWDDERKGSYDNYIFDISADKVEVSTLQGHFVIGGTITPGPWQVTFPVE